MEQIPTAKLVNFFEDHWYLVKDRAIASVTTKLGIERKHFLEKWRGDVGNKVADQKVYDSQQKGKNIHHAMWVYLNGGIVAYNPWDNPIHTEDELRRIKESTLLYFELKNQEEMVDLWKIQQFFNAVKPKVLNTELTVFSLKDDEAGTLDVALEIKAGVYPVNGKSGLLVPTSGIYVCDLKTGKEIEESAFSQISVYAKCYEELGYGKYAGGIILHTGSRNKGGIEGFGAALKTREELTTQYYPIYKHLAAVWDVRHEGEGPRAMKFPSIIKKEN